jgi:hypothetical protein
MFSPQQALVVGQFLQELMWVLMSLLLLSEAVPVVLVEERTLRLGAAVAAVDILLVMPYS